MDRVKQQNNILQHRSEMVGAFLIPIFKEVTAFAEAEKIQTDKIQDQGQPL